MPAQQSGRLRFDSIAGGTLLPPLLRCLGLFEHFAQGHGRLFRQGLAGRDIRRVGKLNFDGIYNS
jgi:hypothetical protein